MWKFLNIFCFLISTVLIISCIDSAKRDASLNPSLAEEVNHFQSDSERRESIFQIEFPEFSFIFSDSHSIPSIQSSKDSVLLDWKTYGELNFEGQTIKIESEEYFDFKVETRIETSVIITEEGAHCDLTEWKHYHSEWQDLELDDELNFTLPEYKESDIKFPEFSLEELKETTKKECAEKFLKQLDNIKSPIEYPVDIAISRYYLKITAKSRDNSKAITKVIILGNMMGC